MIAARGGASEPLNIAICGQGWGRGRGQENPRIHYLPDHSDLTQVPRLRQLRDASTVMRFRPAHQSMINRRFNDRASCPARNSPKQVLARKPPIHSPASGKGGHESGSSLMWWTTPDGIAV